MQAKLDQENHLARMMGWIRWHCHWILTARKKHLTSWKLNTRAVACHQKNKFACNHSSAYLSLQVVLFFYFFFCNDKRLMMINSSNSSNVILFRILSIWMEIENILDHSYIFLAATHCINMVFHCKSFRWGWPIVILMTCSRIFFSRQDNILIHFFSS